MRLDQIRRELAKLRKEVELTAYQLDNEYLLSMDDLSDLTPREIDNFDRTNERLMTEIIQLETLLEIK